MKEYRYKMLAGELWWLGASAEGVQMPIRAGSGYAVDLLPDQTSNQTTTALLSNLGRYIYSDNGFQLRVEDDALLIASDSEVRLANGSADLKGAFRSLRSAFFPSDGKIPPREFFTEPQFNTWIEYMYSLSQDKVLEYAKNIRRSGIGCELLMIDCGWSTYYGSFAFTAQFPDPRGMVDELHAMGFKVMLWVCPFITADSAEFRYLRARDLLVRDCTGSTAIREWWDGYSALIDLTNPAAREWICGHLDRLIADYGVDGFKLDAGDHWYYRDDDINYAHKNAIESCREWAKLGLRYAYNEYRASSNMGGRALVQRLKDKNHSYGADGLKSLVPASLIQNLFGYYYTCPDMIGGGNYQAFRELSAIDEELVVRYCQCSALMPMMQFSLAPWRVLSPDNYGRVLRAVELHKRLAPYFLELAERTRSNAEPIIRLLEYNYPHCGFEGVMDRFMIGDRYLCAPVTEKGAAVKQLRLPPGRWAYGGRIWEGEREVSLPVDLDTVPVFERLPDGRPGA